MITSLIPTYIQNDVNLLKLEIKIISFRSKEDLPTHFRRKLEKSQIEHAYYIGTSLPAWHKFN